MTAFLYNAKKPQTFSLLLISCVFTNCNSNEKASKLNKDLDFKSFPLKCQKIVMNPGSPFMKRNSTHTDI